MLLSRVIWKYLSRQGGNNALLCDGSKSGFKPLVLLPGRMECCGKKVVVRYVEVVV